MESMYTGKNEKKKKKKGKALETKISTNISLSIDSIGFKRDITRILGYSSSKKTCGNDINKKKNEMVDWNSTRMKKK